MAKYVCGVLAVALRVLCVVFTLDRHFYLTTSVRPLLVLISSSFTYTKSVVTDPERESKPNVHNIIRKAGSL